LIPPTKYQAPNFVVYAAFLLILFGCSSTATDDEARLLDSNSSVAAIPNVAESFEATVADSSIRRDTAAQVDTLLKFSARDTVTDSWTHFTNGIDDIARYASTRCRNLPEFQLHLNSEMVNLRAFFENQGYPPAEIQVKILNERLIRSTEISVTTQFFYRGEAISDPGHQRLVLENRRWFADNCDQRELQFSYQCGEIFDEHRGDCLIFYQQVFKSSPCDLAKSLFIQKFKTAFYDNDELQTPKEWAEFIGSCGFDPDHL
jgi:hypothetical protein